MGGCHEGGGQNREDFAGNAPTGDCHAKRGCCRRRRKPGVGGRLCGGAKLVTRNIEFRDNVIPASNSIMAKNLFKLSHYFSNDNYLKTATTMLNNVKPEIKSYGSGFSNWMDLMLNYSNPFFEVAIVGKDSKRMTQEISSYYLPNILIASSTSKAEAPLIKDRYVENKTYIYVCVNNACQLPVESIEKALQLLSTK